MREIKNIKTIIGAIILLFGLGTSTGIMTGLYVNETKEYSDLSGNYDDLYIDYLELLSDFNTLNNTYFILTGEYIELEIDFNTLNDTYNNLEEVFYNLTIDYNDLNNIYNILRITYDALELAYDYITDTIRQSILPVQYSIFAEAVRRYYMPLYLTDDLTTKEWYMGYAEFSRDMVLHDSGQYNAFSEVSDAFSDALIFGNDTIYLAYYIMTYIFWSQINSIHWLPNWDGWDLTGDELTDINTIVSWNIDEIDYEYDLDIILGQEDPTWDYPKFPVETAFRTFGDCEDQSILTAAYLESAGFETVIGLIHDPNHPTLGTLYHAVPLVHIEDTSAYNSMFPSYGLWRFTNDPYYPDYTWSFLDPTWDVPFGSEPSWLAGYGGWISFSYFSIAFNDIDGVIGENIGMEYSIPT